MVLIRETHELRINTSALKIVENADTGNFRDTIITTTVEDQLWSNHAVGISRRRPFGVACVMISRDTTKLDCWEIELLGLPVVGGSVEHTIVANKTLETLSLAVQPVDHVATIASTHSTNVGNISKAVLGTKVINSKHQILERLASPVLKNRSGELLAKRARAVEVGLNDNITHRAIS